MLDSLLALSFCCLCVCSPHDLYRQTRYHATAITIRHIRPGSVPHSGFGLSHLRMSQLALLASWESHNRPCIVSFVCVRNLFLRRRLRYFPSCFTQHFLRQLFCHHRSSYIKDSYGLRWFGHITVTDLPVLASCCPGKAHCCLRWLLCSTSVSTCCSAGLCGCIIASALSSSHTRWTRVVMCPLEDSISFHSALWQITMWADEDCY